MSELPDTLAPSRDSAPTLRDAEPDDRAFLVALYASTRAAELAQFGWTPELQRVFVQMQYDAQHAEYLRRHPDSHCQIIELHRCPIGRLWVASDARSLTIVDISVLPALQGRGIGTDCLRRILAQARDCRLDVELQVVVDSPARRLYERLGFHAVGEAGVRQAMRWRPPPAVRGPALAGQLRNVHHEQA
jgi:GNAT superfamily N-acetyltransferase